MRYGYDTLWMLSTLLASAVAGYAVVLLRTRGTASWHRLLATLLAIVAMANVAAVVFGALGLNDAGGGSGSARAELGRFLRMYAPPFQTPLLFAAILALMHVSLERREAERG